MAQALFINRTDLVRNSILDGNVDSTKFLYFISLSQTIHIQQYLGTDLYKEFETMITAGTLTENDNPNHYNLMINYIQPMLIWFAQVDYIPFAAFSIKNGSVGRHTSENNTPASKEELDYLVAKAREYAEWYTRRFIDYMNFNNATFPAYNSNSNDDIDPSQDAIFNGWVL
tara:strand:+ start:505 stop:1017 length:513 start_codon:yes stop_codon:yes gene_type:complete